MRGRHRRRGARGRAPAPTARPSSWRSTRTTSHADPGQRHRPAAAQDAVRRAVRRPAVPRPTRRRAAGRRRRDRPGPQPERHRAAEGHRRHCCRCCRRSSPQDLSYTLGAVADALRGRGDSLGENLAATGQYFGQVNTVLPQLQADISKLADFADTYQGARRRPARRPRQPVDHRTRRWSTRRAAAPHVHRRATRSSNVTAGFLETNEQNLISLAQTSRPVLGVFAKYSPEYPCLLNGLTRFNPMISQAFGADGDPALNLNITVSLPPRNPYLPGDQPQYADQSGPDCRGLTNIDAIIAAAQHGEYYCPTPACRRRALRGQPDDRQPELPGRQRPERRPARARATRTPPPAVPAVPPGRLDRRTGFRAQHPRLSDRRRSREQVSDLAASTMAPLLRGTQVMLATERGSVQRMRRAMRCRTAGQAGRSSGWSRCWPATC